MKCTFQNSDFARALAGLFKVVPSNPTIPVLAGILAKVHKDRLLLTASDMEVTLDTSIAIAPGAEEGECVISADKLKKLVEKMPVGTVSLETSESSVTITWISGHSVLPVFDAKDYPSPALPSGDDLASVDFVPSQLASSLSGTVPVTSEDESRPAITGVFFDLRGEDACLVGTDTRKLLISGLLCSDMPEPRSFILHRKACGVLRSLLAKPDDKEPVNVRFDSRRAVFTLPDAMLTSSLVAAKFPNYRSIIPSESSSSLTVPRKDLVDMVNLISVCADRSSSMIRFQLSSGSLAVEAQDLGYNAYAQDGMLVDYQGEDLAIGFNAKHLLEVLGSLSCNVLRMHFNGDRRAVLFTPSEEESSITEKAVLMPLALPA